MRQAVEKKPGDGFCRPNLTCRRQNGIFRAVFFNTVCFLAQQGVGKALKSVLYYQGVGRTKLMTHSTVQLLIEASNFIPDLEQSIDDARELDLHYIPARYPNGLPGGFPHTFYGEKTAKAALQCAERIIRPLLDFYRSERFDIED